MKNLLKVKQDKRGYYAEVRRRNGKRKGQIVKGYGQILICPICNEPYFTRNTDIKKGCGNFCSHSCSAKNSNSKRHFSEQTKKKMMKARIKALISGKYKNKNTDIEQKIEKELKRRGIYYQPQVPLCNITVADFYLPQNRTVIYCNGDYWHSKKKVKNRDIIQDVILTFNGFNIYRFSGTQINKSSKRCINKILGVKKC